MKNERKPCINSGSDTKPPKVQAIYPPAMPKNAEKTTSIGITTIAAMILGKIKNAAVSTPITSKASICSFWRIPPISAAILEPTLPANAKATHISLLDGSNCGFELADQPAFSVQYHPEASPGPQDSHYLFEKFAEMMK